MKRFLLALWWLIALLFINHVASQFFNCPIFASDFFEHTHRYQPVFILADVIWAIVLIKSRLYLNKLLYNRATA